MEHNKETKMLTTEEAVEALEGVANMLRGMSFDPSIPKHAQEAMLSKVLELEVVILKYEDDEYEDE